MPLIGVPIRTSYTSGPRTDISLESAADRILAVSAPKSLLRALRSEEILSQEGMMAQKVQSVAELAVQVAQDPALQTQMKNDPAGTIASLAAPLQSDVWIYRFVVGAIGLTLLVALVGIIALAAFDDAVPDALVAIGSGALGALAGLLAPSPASQR
jgi:hypothetical protein